MRYCSIAIILALSVLLAVCCAVECEEESGINMTRFRGLYGKNYVGKLESTATIPEGRSFLTKDGLLLLSGPFICDGKTGKLVNDLSVAVLIDGSMGQYYYNGHLDNYYIVSHNYIYVYSLKSMSFTSRYYNGLFEEYPIERYFYYCDDNYAYGAYVIFVDGCKTYILARYDLKNDKCTKIELEEMGNAVAIFYQTCFEPCFIINDEESDKIWLVDWTSYEYVITKLYSEYERAFYLSNKKIVAWMDVNGEKYAVCFSIEDQSKILWRLPKEYNYYYNICLHELLFITEDDAMICVNKEDGLIINTLESYVNPRGVSWCKDLAVVGSNTNIMNLRTSKVLLPDMFGLEERLAFSDDNETICIIIYDSIVVYSVKDRLEKYRVKYERISRDYDEIYWSGVLNKFIMLRDRDDEYYIYEISYAGMVQIKYDKDMRNICKEIVNLCGVGRSRDVALNIIDDKEWEGYVDISNQVIFVVDYKKRNINIISDGIIRAHVKYDDSFHVRYFIDEKYAIVYSEIKSEGYLYSFKTGNKCLIDYDYVYGRNIVKRDKDIYVYNTETRKYNCVRNLTNLKMKTMCAYDLVFAEQVYNKCFLILRTEPCEPDEQAKRITEFLDNEDKIGEAIEK